jgi:hypothetical protein
MSIMAESGDTGGAGGHGAGPPVGTDEREPAGDGEEVVRLGDAHVSGVESLCVGESQ